MVSFLFLCLCCLGCDIGGAKELGVIYFPTNWGAKEPQNLPNHRVVAVNHPEIQLFFLKNNLHSWEYFHMAWGETNRKKKTSQGSSRSSYSGGNSNIFGIFTPIFWGRWTHFDFRIFFKWVGEPTTNQLQKYQPKPSKGLTNIFQMGWNHHLVIL